MSTQSESSSPAGRVEWLGVSGHPRAPIHVISSAVVKAGQGIVGDYHGFDEMTDRQITLIQSEHLPLIAAFLGKRAIDPALFGETWW